MSYDNILVDRIDNFAQVTINRPQKLNALNTETVAELGDVMERLRNDSKVGCVIVTGSGDRAFVAGADIAEIADLNAKQGAEFSSRGQAVFRAIEKMPKPVVAAVNGFALGGGCELAIACHIRLASESARFGLPEINLGIMPGFGGTQRMARLIGLSNVLHLVCSGRMLDAQGALRMGLVSKIYEDGELLNAAHGLAANLASKAPIAMEKILEAIYRGVDSTLDEGLAIEAELFGQLCDTEDMKIGTSAFLHKRKPEFKGR